MTAETLQISMDIKNHEEESGVRIEYYTLDGQQPEIYMCPGDLYIICNVMHDYASLLETLIPEKEGIEKATYGYHAGRCRKIQQKIESAMNYNVEQAIKKCRKKQGKKADDDDVGEDAMVLAIRRRKKKKESQNQKGNSELKAEKKTKHSGEIEGQINFTSFLKERR